MYILASTEIRQIEMQVELMDAQAVNIGRSFFASSVRTERADVLGSAVESILEGIPCNVGKAEDCINSTKSKCMCSGIAASIVYSCVCFAFSTIYLQPSRAHKQSVLHHPALYSVNYLE